MRSAVLSLLLTLIFVACEGGGAGGSVTPAPSATPTPVPRAVYLSIGDSIQYGCCRDPMQSSGELFRQYLEERLGRPVEWVTVAGNDTADEFVHGINGAVPQLDRAVTALRRFQDEGRPVVAITMSIGGNDYVEVGLNCAEPPCADVFQQILDRMKPQLEQIYAAIAEMKDPRTPLLVLEYYNASDCGQPDVESSPTDIGQRVWNATIDEVATRHGAFIVDLYTAFKGKACEYVEGVDPTYAGYAVITQEYARVYESLPAQYVEPFVSPR